MKGFLSITQQLGDLPAFVQGGGGNVSYKKDSLMLIKASGCCMKEVTKKRGYAWCDHKGIRNYLFSLSDPYIIKEGQFDEALSRWTLHKQSRGVPSIETGFHAVIPSRYVVHTHCVIANIFTCMQGGSSILRHIFLKHPFWYIPYHNPGLSISHTIARKVKTSKKIPPIIFLENQGIITHGATAREALNYTWYVEATLRRYLEKNGVRKKFRVFKKKADFSRHLFPDSIVYSQIARGTLSKKASFVVYEISSAVHYILDTIKALGGRPQYIKECHIEHIKNMEKEKKRLLMIHHA